MGKSKKPGQLQRCKCCLEGTDLKEMWTEYYKDGEREIYGEMLTDCFALPWAQPLESTMEHICENCVSRLRNAVSFKKEILYSEQFLLEHAKNESRHNVKEEEESDGEIETEYLSIEFADDNDNDKGKNSLEIKLESDPKSEPIPVNEEIPVASKTRRRYTEEDLKKCLEAVRNKALSQTKASIIYHVPRKTISAALATETGIKRTRNNDESELRQKRQDNLDNLTKYTNATPFKDVRKGFICYFCYKEYDTPAELKTHNLKDHLGPNLKFRVLSDSSIKLDMTGLKCNKCEENLTTLENAYEHLSLKHELKIHTDAKDLLVPFKFEDDTLKCIVCSEEYTSFKLLNDHMNLKHYKNYECTECGRGFINRKSLQSHRYIHQTGAYPCKFCEQVFTVRIRQWEHERYVHQDKRKRHKCGYCDEKFIDVVTKKKHESLVHGAIRQTFKCKACDNTYFSQAALSRHVKAFHLMLRPFKCSVCGSGFHKKIGLDRHMVKHTKEKNFKCEVCMKSYGRKQTLSEHMRIHINDKWFKCEPCDKMFVHKHSLRGHMRTKHGECV